MTKRLTDDEVLAEVAAARERAREADGMQPRAEAARYDRPSGMVVVELRNGASFSFPAANAQGLRGVSPEVLAGVKVSPSGLGLRWEALDVDLSLPALLQGMFGTAAWMRELARLGGASRSAAKAAAARANGTKGGRPRKERGPLPTGEPARPDVR